MQENKANCMNTYRLVCMHCVLRGFVSWTGYSFRYGVYVTVASWSKAKWSKPLLSAGNCNIHSV